MIVWRGWGVLALFIGLAGGLLAFGAAELIGTQLYPGDPYELDLMQAFNPQLFAICVLGGGALAAVATWFIGLRFNNGHNGHTMFFIPFQWWGPIFGVIAGGVALYTVMTPGPTRMRASFVSECEDHELDANTQVCNCIADKIEAATGPEVYVPFYAAYKSVASSKKEPEGDIGMDFAKSYLSEHSRDQAGKFLSAMDTVGECFGPTLHNPIQAPPST